MFSNHQTSDMKPSGKRISGLPSKKQNQFTIGWDVPINQNHRQKSMNKKRQVQVKLNYIPPNQKPLTENNTKNDYYNQQEVLNSLQKYQNIQQMPSDQLQKVMKYYDNMKNNQKNSMENIPKPQSGYQTFQKRQPIIPKQSAGGIIYGNNKNTEIKSTTKYSQRNRSTLAIGNGYNCFKEDQDIKKKNVVDMDQRIKDIYKYQNSSKRISNIQFG